MVDEMKNISKVHRTEGEGARCGRFDVGSVNVD